MSAEKEVAKAAAEKKPATEEKNEHGKFISVYKIRMHCEGCAKKIKRTVKQMDGVEDVKTDCSSNKLTVTGKVDPAKVKERLEEKTKQQVEIVSAPAKKDGGGEKKAEEKKAEGKKPPNESTVDLKKNLHSDSCISQIKKAVEKTKGVNGIAVDKAQDTMTVTGTMDVESLVPYLNEKIKRNVDVAIPEAKKEEKKEKEIDDLKKEEEIEDLEEEEEKQETGELENFYPYQVPIYSSYDGNTHNNQNYSAESYDQNYWIGQVDYSQGYYNQPHYNQGYVRQAYGMDNYDYGGGYVSNYGYNQHHAPRSVNFQFSFDCSLM